MGLFDKLKKHGPEINSEKKNVEYASNVRLEQLGLIEQLDRNVAVVSDGGNTEIDKAVHMCISQEALNQTLQELKQKVYQLMKLNVSLVLLLLSHIEIIGLSSDEYYELVIYC